MPNNFTVVDRIITEPNNSSGVFNIFFHEFDDTAVNTIKTWLLEDLKYSDINLAPQLPDTATYSNLYETTMNGLELKYPLQKVAFTGQYSDLEGTPDTNDITELVQEALSQGNLNVNVALSYDDLINKPLIPSNCYTLVGEGDNETKIYENFKQVAFTANYEHLINAPLVKEEDKPQNDDELYFNSIAFSGLYEDLIAPGLPEEAYDEESETGFANFAPIAFTGSYADLQNMEFPDINYNDIIGAPGLPEDTNGSSPLYETINDERVIRPFYKIAFTGEYDDLRGAPEIPEINGNRPLMFDTIAFTGITSDDIDAQIIASVVTNVLKLTDFSGEVDGWSFEQIQNNNNQLYNFSDENDIKTYVLQLNSFKKISNNNLTLVNAFQTLISNFRTNKQPSFIVNNKASFLITDVITKYNGPNDMYHIIRLNNCNGNNYNTIRTYLSNITSENATYILNNLKASSLSSTLIIDLENNILYFAGIDNFNYNNLQNTPINLNNILNIENFANLNNQTENNKILTLGNNTCYIMNFDQILNNESTSLIDKIQDITLDYLNNGTTTYLKNENSLYLINNIIQTNNFIEWNLNCINTTNYSTVRQAPAEMTDVIAQNQLDAITFTDIKTTIIFDIDNNIIYCKKQ